MRIIAGSFGGQPLQAPHGHRTHPMSDKVRGALFNMLGDIDGLKVLDLFSGSGAVGLEAVSRGASKATLVEKDRTAVDTIKQNITSLRVTNVNVIQAPVSKWSKLNADAQFDVVIADPPYDDYQAGVLQQITLHVSNTGTLILSLPPTAVVHLGDEFEQVAIKNYGDASLVFYKRTT